MAQTVGVSVQSREGTRIQKDMLPDRMISIDHAGTKEMISSMKTNMVDHLIDVKGVRRTLKRRIVMRRKGLRRNLMVRQYALNVARKATLLGSVTRRCQKLRY